MSSIGIGTAGPIAGPVGGSGNVIESPSRIASAGITLSNSQTLIYANTSAAAFAITLPLGPIDGQRHTFVDDRNSWGNKKLTVVANAGQTIMDISKLPVTYGASTDLTVSGGRMTFEYDANLFRWNPA